LYQYSSGRGKLKMKIPEAAGKEEVSSALRSIEDKLDERGMLVSATGCGDPFVEISYEKWKSNETLVIKITCDEGSPNEEEDSYEGISDYVNEKVAELREEWPAEIRETLEEVYDQMVLLNGKPVCPAG
jgi:hypothetical protein